MEKIFSSSRNVTKTVYIGAGMDFTLLLDRSNKSKLFIYLDCAPFNTSDLVEYCIKHRYSYENKDFLAEMIKKFTSFDGCKMISHDKTINLIVFEYTDNSGIVKIIKYYYASPFPEILDVDNYHSVYNPSNKKKNAILADITGYNVLHIAGYTPHSSILQYASEIIDISGSTGTVYELENHTEEEIKDDKVSQDNVIDNVILYEKINQMIKSDRIRNWSYLKLHWNETTSDYEYIKTITRKATLDNIFKFVKTAVYIGAGECKIDFPANHLPEYDEFICFDRICFNKNEDDFICIDISDDNLNSYDIKSKSDPNTLKQSFKDNGWTLIREMVDIDLLVFTKIVKGKTKTIKYYHSTSFPFDEKKSNNDNKIRSIEKNIHEFHALICNKYTPHKSIFDYSNYYGFDIILSSIDPHDNYIYYVKNLVLGEEKKHNNIIYNIDNIVTMMYNDYITYFGETQYMFHQNIIEKAIDVLFK